MAYCVGCRQKRTASFCYLHCNSVCFDCRSTAITPAAVNCDARCVYGNYYDWLADSDFETKPCPLCLCDFDRPDDRVIYFECDRKVFQPYHKYHRKCVVLHWARVPHASGFCPADIGAQLHSYHKPYVHALQDEAQFARVQAKRHTETLQLLRRFMPDDLIDLLATCLPHSDLIALPDRQRLRQLKKLELTHATEKPR